MAGANSRFVTSIEHLFDVATHRQETGAFGNRQKSQPILLHFLKLLHKQSFKVIHEEHQTLSRPFDHGNRYRLVRLSPRGSVRDFSGQLTKPTIRYTSGTPNGQKISCTLEELGLKYNVTNIEISKNVQKEAWFLEINRMSLDDFC